MILALDIGNSQIFCGVFDREELRFKLGTHQRLRFLQTSLVCFLEGLFEKMEWIRIRLER